MIWQYTLQQKNRGASRVLQGVINKLDAYAAERGLTFSPNKTESMKFRNRRNRNEEPTEIMLRNKIIPSKENTHFWG